ncbi:ACT domain-containing protein [Pseudomonadota bacterium]
MAGEKNLEKLLGSMSPVLVKGEYVFCTLKNSKYGDYADARPIASFEEAEGLTLVLPKEAADRFDLSYDGIFRCITLAVHSSLEAVGLTAAVAGKLADHGIAANMIAAYFHDHVFVQANLAEQVIGLLLENGN